MAEKTIPSEYPPVISRAEAKAVGLKRYFLGLDSPCKRNHVSERLTSSGCCIECATLASDAYRKRFPEREAARRHRAAENTEKIREYSARYREKNPEKVRAELARYLERYPDRVKEAQTRYRKKYPDRVKATQEKYQKENPEKVAAKSRNRRARIMKLLKKRWQER